MQADSEFTNDFHGPADESPESPTSFEVASFDDAVELLEEIGQVSSDLSDPAIERASTLLRQLASAMEEADWAADDSGPATDDVTGIVIEGANTLRRALCDDDDAMHRLCELSDEISDRFGDLGTATDNLADSQWPADEAEVSVENNTPGELASPSAEEIGQLLNAIRSDDSEDQAATADPIPADAQPIQQAHNDAEDDADQIDSDLREAFLDDASRCLASMEASMLSLESNLSDPEPLQSLGRELHTMKGASASIGLSNMANYIHEVEDAIRDIESSGQPPEFEVLLQYVDTIRERVNRFRGQEPSNDQTSAVQVDPLALQKPQESTETAVASSVSFDDGPTDDESVRVKASRLNRLMDMLSELVMLRNQRDTELSNLISIHENMIDSVSRLRMLNQDSEGFFAGHRNNDDGDKTLRRDHGAYLNEITNDVMETAQQLRDCYQPVADGNNHVSQFIRNFRQELVELRRTPIAALFLRLRRAVSDAARAEGKQVTLELSGEDTGIERSLQSRLFEPLLHIVRNSVSHGVESAADRIAQGKPEKGTITLRAQSGPDLLVIEIRDDGRGLDFDAIRRRGLEKGLITMDASIGKKDLAQLIFHPGFSTRESADQVAGRGVGMDVVAATLEKMRGWIEVDSVSGQGTTIRLSLPLPSMIQHVMVFRTGGQLFAVPMQSVQSAGEPDASLNPFGVDRLLGLEPTKRKVPREMIVLGSQVGSLDKESTQTGRVAILVDQIIGPEEVVVRPMPKMFKQHPICSGATLSGLGEVVLLLDAKRLSQPNHNSPRVEPVELAEPTKILVVDDSTSARMRVAKSLSRYNVRVIQSRDGKEAWQTLQTGSFAAVFSDIDMPNMNGMELLEEIKSHPTRKETPVVLVSSRSETQIHDRARELGAVACLPKPLTDAALDSVLTNPVLSAAFSTSH